MRKTINLTSRRRSLARRRHTDGFTLLELMLVMAILVVLASLGTVAYSRIQTSSYERAATFDIKQLRSVCTMYKVNVGSYPNSLNDLVTMPSGFNQATWQGPYLDEGRIPKDPWNRDYIFTANNAQDTVSIISRGADGRQGTPDDIPNGANVAK